jgi:hypothetical protein
MRSIVVVGVAHTPFFVSHRKRVGNTAQDDRRNAYASTAFECGIPLSLITHSFGDFFLSYAFADPADIPSGADEVAAYLIESSGCAPSRRPLPARGSFDENLSEDDLFEFEQRGVTFLGAHPQQSTFPAVEDEAAKQRRWDSVADRTLLLSLSNARFERLLPSRELLDETLANERAMIGDLGAGVS